MRNSCGPGHIDETGRSLRLRIHNVTINMEGNSTFDQAFSLMGGSGGTCCLSFEEMKLVAQPNIRVLPIPERWCVHSYYSLCPYAPDGSGRILISGVSLESQKAEVLVLSADGTVLHRIGSVEVTPSYWHTGLWQSWSPDGNAVYYQSGTHLEPRTTRHDLISGKEIHVDGDIEGMPPRGEIGLSCSHGMLYAAGYGGNGYHPERSPVPFQERSAHGVSRTSFFPPQIELALSTQEILDRHPQREQILEADSAIQRRLGEDEGLTLMSYCVRWNRSGSRCLFFFGNHCVVKDRGEPKITSIFTADPELRDLHLAVDCSFDRFGVHWSWQADDENLIGYGPDPDNPTKLCLAEVRYDGTGYRKISDHASGGHPSTSPVDHNLVVTDEGSAEGGNVVFLSKRTGEIIERVPLPKFVGESEPKGRNALRVCHHPVFNHQGDRVLCNSLPGEFATMVEITPPSLST